jgi:hypothetical protein
VEQPTTHHVAGPRNPSTEISLAARRAQITEQQHLDGITIGLPRRARNTTNNTPAVAQQPLDRRSRYR